LSRRRPSVAEERWLHVAARQRLKADDPRLHGRTGNWRRVRGFARVALFVGGLLIAWLAVNVLDLLQLPRPLMIGGAALMLASEWLVLGRRLWNSGIDEALFGAGALLLAHDIVDGDMLDPATIWSWAIALGLAGWRHLQPLFTTLAVMLGSTALSLTLVPSVFGMNRVITMQMSVLCFAVAGLALLGGAHQYRRPSHDRMLDGVVIALPALGYLWAGSMQGLVLTPTEQSWWAPLYLSLAPLLFGALALHAGLRRRTHAPLYAALLCLVCVVWQLRGWLPVDWHWRLIIWGGAALLVTIVLDRWLRSARAGITSQREADDDAAIAALELAGVAATPASEPARGFRGEGGGFGGGGAGGSY